MPCGVRPRMRKERRRVLVDLEAATGAHLRFARGGLTRPNCGCDNGVRVSHVKNNCEEVPNTWVRVAVYVARHLAIYSDILHPPYVLRDARRSARGKARG